MMVHGSSTVDTAEDPLTSAEKGRGISVLVRSTHSHDIDGMDKKVDVRVESRPSL